MSVNKCERKCCAPECKVKTTENTVFHKFPNDENRKAEWIRACNITTKVNNDSLICGAHFTKDDYVLDSNSMLRGLKTTAVPKPHSLENLESSNTTGSNNHKSPIQNKRKCSVPQCKPATTNERRSYHTVPKDQNLRKQWVNACGLAILANPQAYVCSAHFDRGDFITGPTSRKQVLNLEAVPTENLPIRAVQRIITSSNAPTNKPTFADTSSIIKADKSVNVSGGPVMKAARSVNVPAKNKSTLDNTNPTVKAVESVSAFAKNKQIFIQPRELEEDEKVTTIIYVPENCSQNIIATAGSNLKNTKLITNNQSSLGSAQNNLSIPNAPDIRLQGRISSTKRISIVKSSTATPKRKSPEVQGHSENTKHVAKKFAAEPDNSNEIVNLDNSNENVSNQTNKKPVKRSFDSASYKKTIIRQGVSAVTLCADCGQYCKIEDEDLLYKSHKNSETLAAELLLDVQELELLNEDERMLLTRKGIEICNKAIQKQSINLMEMLTNDNELIAFTGINFKLLEKLTDMVSNVEGISAAKQNTPAKTRIVVCLCKLRINLSFACLGMLFGTTQQLCAGNFFSMLKTLSALLEKTIHWPKTEELLKDLPECFQSFKQTRVILNCSETQIDKQRCYNCQKKLAANANQPNQAIKLVLGVAPSGLIIFKSNVFESQLAEVSVFKQTNIMDKLDPAREAIMSDKTINIEAECVEHNITLIKLPKLGKNKQFGKHDVELIKNISTARIHVDRTLKRFRLYKIMQTKVHWRILPYLDDVCTVIAGIVNMNNPIPPNIDIDIKTVRPIRR